MIIDNTTFRSPNYWAGRAGHDVVAIVLHDTEGTFPSDAEYLCATNRAALTSAHYVVHETDVYELVSPDNRAWHCAVSADKRRDCPNIRAVIGWGNENNGTIGIEISGPRNGVKSEAVYRTVAELVRRLMARYPSIKADRNHIFGHDEINTDKVDPEPWEWDKFMSLLADDSRIIPQTGHTVRGGFRELYEQYGPEVTGYPLTEELNENDTTVQYFENVRMEWRPGTRAHIGPLGRDYLALKEHK